MANSAVCARQAAGSVRRCGAIRWEPCQRRCVGIRLFILAAQIIAFKSVFVDCDKFAAQAVSAQELAAAIHVSAASSARLHQARRLPDADARRAINTTVTVVVVQRQPSVGAVPLS